LFITLNPFPASGYSSGNTTIIETEKRSSYSLLDRKFIFDQAENKASQGFKKSQELKSQDLSLFSEISSKPIKQEGIKVSAPPKMIIQAKQNSLKNSEITNNLSNWDKFKKSNSEINSTDETLNVNARLLKIH